MKTIVSPKTGLISVQVRTPQGVRRISTGCTDKAEAAAVIKAANIETLEVLAKAGQLSQSLVQKLVVGSNITVAAAIEEWSMWLNDTANSVRTAETQIMYVKAWAHEAKALERKLVSITPKDLDKWVNGPDSGKMATRNIRLTSLRSFFKLCSIRGYMNPDPAREIGVKAKLMTHEQKEPKVRRVFTDAEFNAVLDYITLQMTELINRGAQTDATDRKLDSLRFWFAATVIGRYSGLRLGDIASLEWASLQVPGKLVVWTDKQDTRIELPVSPELKAGIDAIVPNSKKVCFPEQDRIARDYTKRARLSVEFTRILQRSGVEGHSFHDLRHTIATELDCKGETIEEIAEKLGHRSKESSRVYIHKKEGQSQ